MAAFFPPGEGDGRPKFPPQLSTEEQGRFALGFYQQMAYDLAAASVRGLLRDARKAADKPEEACALIAQARKRAEALGYQDLIELALTAEKHIQ